MSFAFRPLLAVAAIALATPAFAQVGTTAPSTDKAVTAPAPAVTAPSALSPTGTAADVKAPAMKTDSTATPAPSAGASTPTDSKTAATPAEKPAKVSAVKHHKAKTVKTAAAKSDVKSDTTTK